MHFDGNKATEIIVHSSDDLTIAGLETMELNVIKDQHLEIRFDAMASAKNA